MNLTENPTGLGAVVSATAKAVLMAFVVTKVLPWDEATTSTVALAVAAVVDLAVLFGLVKPRVTPIAAPKAADGTPLVKADEPFDRNN